MEYTGLSPVTPVIKLPLPTNAFTSTCAIRIPHFVCCTSYNIAPNVGYNSVHVEVIYLPGSTIHDLDILSQCLNVSMSLWVKDCQIPACCTQLAQCRSISACVTRDGSRHMSGFSITGHLFSYSSYLM